jgi:hypothetical protein
LQTHPWRSRNAVTGFRCRCSDGRRSCSFG